MKNTKELKGQKVTPKLLASSDSGKVYVKPAVLTHSGEDILDELGPAQACYPFNSCGVVP